MAIIKIDGNGKAHIGEEVIGPAELEELANAVRRVVMESDCSSRLIADLQIEIDQLRLFETSKGAAIGSDKQKLIILNSIKAVISDLVEEN